MKTFALMAVTAMYAAASIEDGQETDLLVDSIAGDISLTALDDGMVMEEAPLLMEAPMVGEASIEGDIEIPEDNGEQNIAIAAQIDDAMAQAGQQEHEDRDDDPVPDNYRPPPKQDIRRRERRERPDIHSHALLKSMDLGFVSNGFGSSRPKEDGPIGFLGNAQQERPQQRGMMGNFQGLGQGVGGY